MARKVGTSLSAGCERHSPSALAVSRVIFTPTYEESGHHGR